LYLSAARASRRCVACCELPFFNIAEVGITGPKWHGIRNTVICKTLDMKKSQ
jgi:hypothetical protein